MNFYNFLCKTVNIASISSTFSKFRHKILILCQVDANDVELAFEQSGASSENRPKNAFQQRLSVNKGVSFGCRINQNLIKIHSKRHNFIEKTFFDAKFTRANFKFSGAGAGDDDDDYDDEDAPDPPRIITVFAKIEFI